MRPNLRSLITTALLVAALGCWHPVAQAAGLSQTLEALARPLDSAEDLTPMIERAGRARLALLGEASHGTSEFYTWRDLISRRLIREQGFSFIAIEGEWSALIPLDRYVRHHPHAPASARAALLGITQWPQWVWANRELEQLAEWLRGFNRDRPAAARVGIHGIDLYAVWESLEAVRAFYRRHLPAWAEAVDRLYAPLRAFQGDTRGYARHGQWAAPAAQAGAGRVAEHLAVLYREAPPSMREVLFEALQHARVVQYGERCMAGMLQPGPGSWNTRSEHFAQTVARLLRHYGPGSRGIVWAHNTHVVDARATDMARTGQVSLGQLARERQGAGEVFQLGFGTAEGSLIAARRWDGVPEVMAVPPPRPDSLEAALRDAGDGDRLLLLEPYPQAYRALREELPHRLIGVVFQPERAHAENYLPLRLAEGYDAFVFLPHTRALHPLTRE